MEQKMSHKEILLIKLGNVLQGEAKAIIDKTSIVPIEQRKEAMKAVEELKNYLDNYDKNMKLINQAIEDNLRMEDDGR